MRQIYIEHEGKSLTMRQWAEVIGMPKRRIKSRWDRGVRDSDKLLTKNKIHAESKWDYSNGVIPICTIHDSEGVFHKSASKKSGGQWACRECEKENTKKTRDAKRDTLSHQLKIALYAARSRNKCSLTIDDLSNLWEKQDGKCAITGKDMEYTPGDNRHNRFKFSLDRIDNSKPYTEDNVWFVLEYINRAKSDLNQSELIDFAKGILRHFGK